MKHDLSRWMSTLLVAGLLVGTFSVSATGEGAPKVQAAARVTVVSDTPLPKPFEWASDVRWASDHSVYLALAKDGTVEVNLDSPGVTRKEMIPGASKPGGFWGCRWIAASSRYLVAAGPGLSLTWRGISDAVRKERPFDVIEGVDVRENRLAVVGVQRDEQGRFGPDGAIAWIGSLDKDLSDLKPIAYDVRGPGAPTMNRCIGAGLGGARFLADGSLVVVPGVQPGIHLYDDHGKLMRTWDTAKLGIDTDCGSLTDEQGQRFAGSAAQRGAWVNQRRSVDATLSLPRGIGLIVRRVEQERTFWDLKLLRSGGAVETVSIPLQGEGPFFHLAGDVRGGRIVFLLREVIFRGGSKDHPSAPRLIVASGPLG